MLLKTFLSMTYATRQRSVWTVAVADDGPST
jgi:hypothetical protein